MAMLSALSRTNFIAISFSSIIDSSWNRSFGFAKVESAQNHQTLLVCKFTLNFHHFLIISPSLFSLAIVCGVTGAILGKKHTRKINYN